VSGRVAARGTWKRPPIASADELLWDREIARIRQCAGVKRGTPCVLCGSTLGAGGHHPSYLRPHETVALCAKHHKILHIRLKRRGRCPYELYVAARRAGTPCPLPPSMSPSEAVRSRWLRERAAS
jgi:hypothetical protein